MVNTAMRARLPMAARGRLPDGLGVRPLAVGDVGAVGALMHVAYKGGVEDQGQDEHWHAAQAEAAFKNAHGPVLWLASTLVHKGEEVLAATVVTDWQEQGELLLAYALVHPVLQGRGLGSWCISRSAAVLAKELQARDWVLAVAPTSPARQLYERLGFVEFDPRTGSG